MFGEIFLRFGGGFVKPNFWHLDQNLRLDVFRFRWNLWTNIDMSSKNHHLWWSGVTSVKTFYEICQKKREFKDWTKDMNTKKRKTSSKCGELVIIVWQEQRCWKWSLRFVFNKQRWWEASGQRRRRRRRQGWDKHSQIALEKASSYPVSKLNLNCETFR